MPHKDDFSIFILVSVFIFLVLFPAVIILLQIDDSVFGSFEDYRDLFTITGFPVAEDVMSINKYFKEPMIYSINIENKEFTVVELSNCISTGKIGEPSLPLCPVNILIPQGKGVSSIGVEYLDDNKIEYYISDKPIIPKQKEIPLSCEDAPEFIMNGEVYSLTESFPYEPYENRGTGLMNGFNILTINLNPIKYTPLEGKIQFYPEIEISVKLDDGFGVTSEKNDFLRLKEKDIDRLSSFVSNPEMIESYSKGLLFGPLDEPLNGSCTCDPSKTYEYVIITNGSLLNSSGYNYSWYDLIEHRKNYSGFNGTIVTIQQIDNCSNYWNDTYPFNDSAYRIREFIKDAYQNWGTEYVLLGGNWRNSQTSQQIVPYRLFTDLYETDTYDTMPCDLYYSNLDGDWWYSNQSIWGGGRNSPVNDKFSEIYVGRITAYTPAHVSNAVSKIIWYDTNAHNDEWLRTVTFAGDNLGWSVTSKQYMEELRIGNGSFDENVGFEEWNAENIDYPFYTLENKYYDADGNWNQFTSSIESDNSSIINHIGHSTWSTPFSLPQWSSRENTQPFFGYTQGCLAGRYSYGYAGCEQLMCSYPERHAFALVLNTGYGYGNSYSTEGASQQQQKIFWDYFFNENVSNYSKWELGRAHAYSKDEFSAYIDLNHAKCYIWYSAHLFGDPAQRLELTNETKPNGEVCYAGSECDSGFCVDSVCCSSESCGVCQACNINGSKGNCSNQEAGSDLNDDCSTSECGTGYCDGLGSCAVYNDSLRHNCSICYYCADLNVSCDLIPNGQDPNTDCILGNTSLNGCSGDYCDGSGSCQILSSGDGGCPACTLCSDNDTNCEYYDNNTQDDNGNLTCSGICEKCNGVGGCINQNSGEDLFDQCDSNLECHIGYCDGYGECDVYSDGEKGSCGPCMYCIDDDSNCEYVPAGEDPFDECIGLQCDEDALISYYWGWDSLTCYYSSDVSAIQHYCEGDGSCYDAEDACPLQSKNGATNITCEREESQYGCNLTTIGNCQNHTIVNNSAPTTPTLISPINGASNTDNSLDLDWNDSTDIDNDSISYYLSIYSSLNSTLVIYNTTESGYSSYTTTNDVTYYWKVKSSDGESNSSWSSEWNFKEETETPPKKTSSSGGGGGGSAPIGSTSTTQSITYDLSETKEEEVKEVVKSKLNEVSSKDKEVYKDVLVDISVDHPDSDSTSLDFNFKYGEGKPLKNVLIFIEIPKSFAESASDITLNSSVPYSEMEIVEDDPLYYFFYEELESDNVSYSFSNKEYSVGSSVIEDASQPLVFFETEVSECGNNIIEEGEECDGGAGCSSECILIPIPRCVDDGDCTSEETELGNCNDCIIRTPLPTNFYSILREKWFVALLIVFIAIALIIGFKLENKNKKRKK